MEGNYRAVRLIRNRQYPTYQLRAAMSSGRTTPRQGLRLAALITLEWLAKRLGPAAPDHLLQLPAPSEFCQAEDCCLTSFQIQAGFSVDVVALPSQGVWALHITEPDLGSDPGNPEQSRQAVPGRVIETNIGYRVLGKQLECGFQTVISDPEGTEPQAEVYRLAVVRQLMEHPQFGLRQIAPLSADLTPMDSVAQLKGMMELWRSGENQLPCVVFAPPPDGKELRMPIDLPAGFPPLPGIPARRDPEPPAPAYDAAGFARSCMAFCRTWQLSDEMLERFREKTGLGVEPGDIAVLEPACFGGSARVLPYRVNEGRRRECLAGLREVMHAYPRGRTVDFGPVCFVPLARQMQLDQSRDELDRSRQADEDWSQRLERERRQWQADLAQKEETIRQMSEQLRRQREYQNRLEQEKEQLRQEQARALDGLRLELEEQRAKTDYLRRKLSQPKEHSQISSWVETTFPNRLMLHPRAVALLEDRSARSVNVQLICDALDFLATDYWDCRYRRISGEERDIRCSEKYGRPFEVKRTGASTIEFTPAEYKVKYFPGAKGKPVESALDYHLRVGNDPENLLRIYFLHDDQKQLIVVGSLPRHLRAVTIQ